MGISPSKRADKISIIVSQNTVLLVPMLSGIAILSMTQEIYIHKKIQLVERNLLQCFHNITLLELNFNFESFKVVQLYSETSYFVASTLQSCRGLMVQYIGFKAETWAGSIWSFRFEYSI